MKRGNEMKYWLWLMQIPRLGPILAKTLLEKFKSPQGVYEASYDALISVDGIGEKLARRISDSKSFDQAYKTLRQLRKHQIKLLTYDDPYFPDHLKSERACPPLLYYKGNLNHNARIAISGNYTIHLNNQIIIDEALKTINDHNYTLVTGLTQGIQSHAIHKYCQLNGPAYVFLPYGLDQCHPQNLRWLYKSITKKGALISQYPIGTQPIKGFYLANQDLQAAWADKLFIPEATATHSCNRLAKLMHAQSKQVLVLPHRIEDDFASGSNTLLKDFATCYLSPQQLIESIEVKQMISPPVSDKLTSPNMTLEDHIILLLKERPHAVDELALKLKKEVLDLVYILMVMELDFKVQSLPGNQYTLPD